MIRALLGTILFTALIVQGQDKVAKSVGSILSKHIKAIGGMGANKRQKTRQMTGTLTVTAQGENAKPWKATIIQKAPNLKYTKIEMPDRGVTTEGFDGEKAWRSDPVAGPKELTGAEFKQKRWEADFYAAVNFKKQYKRMVYEGETPVNDKTYHVLKGIREDGREVVMYINPETYLIDQMTVPMPDPQMPSFMMTLSDYRVVDGVKMPFKLTLGNANQTFLTMKIDEIKHGIKVDNTLFAMPKEDGGDPTEVVQLDAQGRPAALGRFVGVWESVTTNLLTGVTEPVAIKTRTWSMGGKGKFLMEEEVSQGKEIAHLMYVHDPKANRYRSVYLGRNYAVGVTGTWNDKAQRMTWSFIDIHRNRGEGYHKFFDSDNAEWGFTVKDPKGKTIWRIVCKQKRRVNRVAIENMNREPELNILGALSGEWTTWLTDKETKKQYSNTSNSTWSRDGNGMFLLTDEKGVEGEKHTVMTFDPKAKVYRGCFLEQGASGFIEAKYHRDRRLFQQDFYMFALPPGDNTFADGLHGAINIHFMERTWGQMTMNLKFGKATVWEGTGKIVRDGGKK